MTSEVTERSVGLIQYRIPDPYRRLMVGAPLTHRELRSLLRQGIYEYTDCYTD